MVFDKTNCWRLFKLILLSTSVILYVSCSSEIEINGDGQAVPILYCFLNPDDSIQYLRLSKTFTIPVGNPDYRPTAKDLTYTEEPEVYVSEDESGYKQRFFKCTLVDGFSKDTGWFPSGGMQIFESHFKIKPSTQYSLILYFHSENRIVFGQTHSFGSDLRIIDPSLIQFREVDLFPGQDYFVRFTPVVNAKIYQATMTLVYDEIQSGLTERKEFDFTLEPLLNERQDVGYLQQKVNARLYFKTLVERLPIIHGVTRKPVCFRFQISCGGDELYFRVKSEINVNAFSDILYTNLSNAQGLFSSLRHQFIEDVKISRFTIDSLAMSSSTKQLGFLSFKDLSK